MTITTSWAGPRPAVSRTLYGLFLEDINFAADGGLNANLVNNWTFDGAYLDRTGAYGVWTQLLLKRPVRGLEDPLRHWHANGGVLSAQTSGGERPGARYARWQVQGSGQLANHGYPGDSASMGGRRGVAFTLSLLTRADAFTGTLTARLLDTSRTVAATAEVHLPTDGWQRITTTLTPPATGLYSLQFEAIGNGTIDLDEVSLVAADHWGAGDPRWSQGRLRRDLVETLADLRPTFLRFPGGCIVEGTGDGNHYEWKKTVGPLSDRSAKYSLWGRGRRGDYSQSNQIGFYEYFLLCEDLGIEPVPVVWAGLACQYRSHECLDASSPEFAQALQDAVDLVDWATGDPASSPWAALRAEAGHPEPFPLNFVGIGNENHGPAYHDHFDAIRSAIDAVRPGLRYVHSTGAFPKGATFDASWRHATGRTDVIVDEHMYDKPAWFIQNTDRYDSYPRTGATIMVGEWAANPGGASIARIGRPNTWASAVAEAAFMTGIERNVDLVEMTCYAPLLALHNAKQWNHNLIDFTPLTVLRTLNYEVQKLFAEAVGDVGLAVRVTGGDGVLASATGSTDSAFVKLVNPSKQPATVTVELDIDETFTARLLLLTAPPRSRAEILDAEHTRTPLSRTERDLGLVPRRFTVELPAWSVARIDLAKAAE